MAYTSVTYTFTNATVADATQVNQNFTDLINGLSDGTKDISCNAFTAAGAATLNGNVTLGNASGDDITFTGSLAATIPIKTTNTYDIGAATKGLAGIYLGANSQTVRLIGSASMSATWTLTLPTTAGTDRFLLMSNGSGVSSWEEPNSIDDVRSEVATYAVTTTDACGVVLMTTSNTGRTVTLPAASTCTDRRITIKKIDSGTGTVTIDPNASETIDGATTFILYHQYQAVTLVCDGSNWHKIADFNGSKFQLKTLSSDFTGTSPATAATDLTFNGLVSGNTYRITFMGYPSGAAHVWIQYGVASDPTKYTYYRCSTANQTVNFSKVFVSDGTAVKIYLGSSGTSWIMQDYNDKPSALSGGPATKTTFAILEDLSDFAVETSAFT